MNIGHWLVVSLMAGVMALNGCGGGGGGGSSKSSVTPAGPAMADLVGTWEFDGDNSLWPAPESSDGWSGPLVLNSKKGFTREVYDEGAVLRDFVFGTFSLSGEKCVFTKSTGEPYIDATCSLSNDKNILTIHYGAKEDLFTRNSIQTAATFRSVSLNYANNENPDSNRFDSWVVIVNENKEPLSPDDLAELDFKDASGVILASKDNFEYRSEYTDSTECLDESCSNISTTKSPAGFYIKEFLSPPGQGNYIFEAQTLGGETIKSVIYFPGQLSLPVIKSNTMVSQRNLGNIRLNWTNPSSDEKWAYVDELRIYLYDSNGEKILSVRLSPQTEEFTVLPEVLGGLVPVSWRMQTRAHNGLKMLYAYGLSNKATIN